MQPLTLVKNNTNLLSDSPSTANASPEQQGDDNNITTPNRKITKPLTLFERRDQYSLTAKRQVQRGPFGFKISMCEVDIKDDEDDFSP